MQCFDSLIRGGVSEYKTVVKTTYYKSLVDALTYFKNRKMQDEMKNVILVLLKWSTEVDNSIPKKVMHEYYSRDSGVNSSGRTANFFSRRVV